MGTDQKTKDQLIEAILNHVPFDGWTRATLATAADDCGLSDVELNRLFPAGITDAIAAYATYADNQMIAAFHEHCADQFETMPLHIRIRTLIILRLELAAPHKEVVRRTLAVLGRPTHVRLATRILYNTVDAMWRTAGDTSTDYNFYTKRATLSAVYSATLLAFLSDNTADMTKTQAFLDRRLAEIARIPKMTRPAKGMANMAGRMAMRFARTVMRARRTS